ncbi:uncharacterized protein CMU_011580 [Cryptosporidium muris RN66]|uniref:Uncharacterized protein n=1 Tax=Cryptosporidium muris (strain RN66) TaxID=441375 RepID=B6AJ17_CRYMR|nr:uncharacterized protein CMU_011580 [Cryptosporidium muris RN66]EEA08208.1 hypothetical protein CMU_011580 [Cryptosporidium muris RN66]|eukprot:XP_002142557.1 hypothetical protein [Cryptosporidium muris RN66]
MIYLYIKYKEQIFRLNLEFLYLLILIQISNVITSNIYYSSSQVLSQLTNPTNIEIEQLTDYPYIQPEFIIAGYDTPFIREPINSSKHIYNNKDNINKTNKIKNKRDNYQLVKYFRKEQKEFEKIEKQRRRNEEDKKKYLEDFKSEYKYQDSAKHIVESFVRSSNTPKKDIKNMNNEIIRKYQSTNKTKHQDVDIPVSLASNIKISNEKVNFMKINHNRIHYATGETRHTSNFYDINSNCYWTKRNKGFVCLTINELKSLNHIDPTISVAFDSSIYSHHPQPYGNDQECVTTHRDTRSVNRVCTRYGGHISKKSKDEQEKDSNYILIT